jgi:hypothetical protein
MNPVAIREPKGVIAPFALGEVGIVETAPGIIHRVAVSGILAIDGLEYQITVLAVSGVGAIIAIHVIDDVAGKERRFVGQLGELYKKRPRKIIFPARGHLVPVIGIPFISII